MTYIAFINRFWSIHEKVTFSPHEIAVFFYLLRECNRQKWPSPLVIANKSICMGLSISESTLIRCRERLVSNGVLGFKSEKDRRKPPAYYLRDYLHKKSSNDGNYLQSESSDDSSYLRDYLRDYFHSESIYKDNKIEDNIPPYNPPHGEVVDVVDKYSEFLKKYFQPNRQAALEQLCMSLGLTLDDLKRLAEQVVIEWRCSEQKHTDFNDAARHLINQIRIKINLINGQRKDDIRTDRRGTDADGKAEKNWDETF